MRWLHFTHVDGGGGLAQGAEVLVEVGAGGGGADDELEDVGPGDGAVLAVLEGHGAGEEAVVAEEVPLDEEEDAPSHVHPSCATHCHCSANNVQSRAEPLQYSPLPFQLHPRCPSQRVRPE